MFQRARRRPGTTPLSWWILRRMSDDAPATFRIPTGLRYMVLARSVVALVLTFWMLRRAAVAPWGQRKGLLFFRGLVGFFGLLCVFYALTKLPLADATVIQYTNPVFTALLAALFLREALTHRDVLGLVLSLLGVVLVALLGVVLVAQPTFLFGAGAYSLNLLAVGVALAGAFFSAIAYVTVRKLRETEHHLVVVLYFPLVAAPASVPVMWNEALWPTPWEWLALLGIGVATQIAQVYLTKGLHTEKAGRAMSMSYVQIVFAALWGLLFFDEVPDPLTILGAVLVVAGTLTITRSPQVNGE